MLKSKHFLCTSLLSIALLFLPSCQPLKNNVYTLKNTNKQPVLAHKQVQKPTISSPSVKTYKEQKELIKQKQKIKNKIHSELPRHIKDMNREELIKGREYCIELGYMDLAIKYLERLIIVTENVNELKKYRIELADYYFEAGEFEKAGKLYAQYLEYYPGSIQREYVEYKIILCRFYATLQSDRDQSKTKETLILTQNYLEKSDIYTTYIQDVQQIQHASYIKLVEAETEIVQFYLRRNKYKAAENRLAHIKNDYLRYAQEYEPNILKLEIQLAEAQGHTGIANQKQTELATRFPENIPLTMAMNTKNKHVSRF